MLLFYQIFFLFGLFHATYAKRKGPVNTCKDVDHHCLDTVSHDSNECIVSESLRKNCARTCAICGNIEPKFDVRHMPELLKPLAFLVGIWRAESGGKAVFPTIPVFTYGEQVEFSLPDTGLKALKALNYTAFAWDMNNRDELHSEYGYITMKPGTKEVALSTVMDNGFVTIEEGQLNGKSIRFTLVDIGRISFSRDLPVHGIIRELRLLSSDTLEQRLLMETLTHRMQMHTFIRYTKIYP